MDKTDYAGDADEPAGSGISSPDMSSSLLGTPRWSYDVRFSPGGSSGETVTAV